MSERKYRTVLSKLLTKEYMVSLMRTKIDGEYATQQQMADLVVKKNGGTCGVGTINRYMRLYNLVPDTVRKYLKVGLDTEMIIEGWELHDTSLTEPPKEKVNQFLKTILKNDYVEDIVVMISDLQIGACVTADGFDPIPEETIQKYVDTFCNNLIQMFERREIEIGTIHLCLLGDIVDGELMFPRHKTIDMNSQIKIAIRVIRQIIEVLKAYCNHVNVLTVAGNHGRISHTHHKSSNYDNMVYDTLEIVYDGDAMVSVSADRAFVQLWTIGKWQMLATHGGIIRGMITRQKAINKSGGFQRRMPHDAFLMGHFHTTMMMNFNRMPIVINGCMYDSDFIQNELAGWECKRQIVFKVGSRDYPIDWMEMIDVE